LSSNPGKPGLELINKGSFYPFTHQLFLRKVLIIYIINQIKKPVEDLLPVQFKGIWAVLVASFGYFSINTFVL